MTTRTRARLADIGFRIRMACSRRGSARRAAALACVSALVAAALPAGVSAIPPHPHRRLSRRPASLRAHLRAGRFVDAASPHADAASPPRRRGVPPRRRGVPSRRRGAPFRAARAPPRGAMGRPTPRPLRPPRDANVESALLRQRRALEDATRVWRRRDALRRDVLRRVVGVPLRRRRGPGV